MSDKILFFIAGPVPAEEQREAAAPLKAAFRNGSATDSFVERADAYAGLLPEKYLEANLQGFSTLYHPKGKDALYGPVVLVYAGNAELVERFKKRGYVEELPEPEGGDKPISKLDHEELAALADELGLVIPEDMTTLKAKREFLLEARKKSEA